jgi:cytochrome c peroxidase
MHTGQVGTLAQVVAFFNQGGDAPGGYPGTSEIHALGLSALDQSDLVAFLQALTGPGAPSALQVAPIGSSSNDAGSSTSESDATYLAGDAPDP